jgi:hypothetical protein
VPQHPLQQPCGGVRRFLREEYPPFAFDTVAPDCGDYPPVRTGFAPELEHRTRLTVGFRIILAIPPS